MAVLFHLLQPVGIVVPRHWTAYLVPSSMFTIEPDAQEQSSSCREWQATSQRFG
jgi:hypothetical protein